MVRMKGKTFVFLGILTVTGLAVTAQDVDLTPFGTVSVVEYGNFTLTCQSSEAVYLVKWEISGRDVYLEADNCTLNSFDRGYVYTCDKDENSFTISHMNVTIAVDGSTFRCAVVLKNSASLGPSNEVKLIVQVPVVSVSITHLTDSSSVLVNEYEPSQLTCTTSVERPRSTVKWYIEGNNEPLSGVSVSPNNDDALTNTVSTLNYTFTRSANKARLYCTAVNIEGKPSVRSNSTQVIVRYVPDAGPDIIGYDGVYTMIESVTQYLTCYVRGGNPVPKLTWDCYNGNETDIFREGEVRKNITWTTPIRAKGKCTCTSEQENFGDKTEEVLDVHVLFPPEEPVFSANGKRFWNIFKEVIGRSVSINCSSTSNPSPSYIWSSSTQEPLPASANMDFKNITTSAVGTYNCKVKNTMTPSAGMPKTTTNSATFELVVLFPPKTLSLAFKSRQVLGTLYAILGDDVSVACSAHSNPAPTFKWTGQSTGNNSLIISNIQESRNYTCTVSNRMDPTIGPMEDGLDEATLIIIVMKPPTAPRLSYIPQSGAAVPLVELSLAVIEGTSFSVKCFGSIGYPKPSLRWPGVESDSAGTISFINIGKLARGWYTCNASNTMNRTFEDSVIGRSSTTLVLDILYAPEIVMIDNKTLQENKPLILPCIANSNPPPLSYKWTRSKDSLRQDSQNFFIQHVTRNDTDMYTCTVRNIMKPTFATRPSTRDSKISVAVRVLYFPNVNIHQPNGTILVEGAVNVILVCTADGDPKNFTFKNWKHLAPDGITIIREYTAFEHISGQVQLTFLNASYMDSGIFECSVSNGIIDYRTNLEFAISRITQRVKGHPVVTVNDSRVTAAVRGDATLTASYYSNDDETATVQWYRYKNGNWQEIINDDNQVLVRNRPDTLLLSFYGVQFHQPGNASQLLLANVSQKDFTHYKVKVLNSIGSIFSSTILLDPEDAPETPTELAVLPDSVTSSTITVTWKPGFHGGDNQVFHIQYNTSTTPWTDGATVKGFKLTSYLFNATISQLSSETQYYFRIFSENRFGKSLFSDEVVTARTRSDVEDQGASFNVGLIAGGAVGGVVLAAIIVGVIVLILRRRQDYLKRPRKSLLKDNERPAGSHGADDTPEINLNPMYESAGQLPSTPNNSDVYSQVDKTGKNMKKGKPAGDIYSQVNKPKTRQNTGGSEMKNDVYAQVEKNTLKKKDAGKPKLKKQKPDKKKKEGRQTEGDLYDNVDTINSVVSKEETTYENPSCSIEDEHPKQTRYQNELVYAILDLPKETVGKDRKAVIHGLDDRTDYADIQYGEVGEQAPESDEESTKIE